MLRALPLCVSLACPVAAAAHPHIFVDTGKSHEVYKEWLAMTKPAPGPGNLRRPLWIDRPVKPTEDAYYM